MLQLLRHHASTELKLLVPPREQGAGGNAARLQVGGQVGVDGRDDELADLGAQAARALLQQLLRRLPDQATTSLAWLQCASQQPQDL